MEFFRTLAVCIKQFIKSLTSTSGPLYVIQIQKVVGDAVRHNAIRLRSVRLVAGEFYSTLSAFCFLGDGHILVDRYKDTLSQKKSKMQLSQLTVRARIVRIWIIRSSSNPDQRWYYAEKGAQYGTYGGFLWGCSLHRPVLPHSRER